MVTRMDTYPDVAIPPGEYLAEVRPGALPRRNLPRAWDDRLTRVK